MVRKPFRADGDRRQIAEAQADADHHAPRQIQHGQRLRVAREEKTGAVQESTDRRHRAWTDAALKRARQQKRRGEHHHVDRRDQRCLRAGPVEFALERRHEHAPRVVGAEGDVEKAAAHEGWPARQFGCPYRILRRHGCRYGW